LSLDAIRSPTPSVATSVNAPDWAASADIVSRATPMLSCLKPAVAVSIRTRTGAAGGGDGAVAPAAGDRDAGVDGAQHALISSAPAVRHSLTPPF